MPDEIKDPDHGHVPVLLDRCVELLAPALTRNAADGSGAVLADDELGRRIPALRGRHVSVLIWTTTPWTIPSNLAIAFHPEYDYAAYDVDGRAVIVAEGLAASGAIASLRTAGSGVTRCYY